MAPVKTSKKPAASKAAKPNKPAASKSKPAVKTKALASKKTKPKAKLDRAVDKVELAPKKKAPDAGASSSVKKSGKRIEQSPLAGPSLQRQLPAEKRLQDLQNLGDRVYAAIEESDGFEDSEPWQQAIRAIEQAGITRSTRVGPAYDAKLEGSEGRVQRTEWFLGQLLSVMSGISQRALGPYTIYRFQKRGAEPELPFGSDMVAAMLAEDEKNRGLLKQFVAEQRKQGLLEAGGKDGQFAKLFGSNSVWGYEQAAYLGRKLALVVEDDYRYTSLVGQLVPSQPGDGAVEWRIQPVRGGEAIKFNLNHLKAFFVEDRSAVSLAALKKRAHEQGWLESDSELFKDLIDRVNGKVLEGRYAAFLVPDLKTREFRLVEGALAPSEKTPFGPMFCVDTKDGRVELNSNELGPHFVEDRSASTPQKLAARAKAEGLVECPRGLDWATLDGKKALAIDLDREGHVYRLYEGVIRHDPQYRFGSVIGIQTQSGLAQLRTWDLKGLYVELPAQ